MPLYDFNHSGGGGSFNVIQIIIDVGQTPVFSTAVMVSDPNVSTTSKITAWQDAAGFSGHPPDEAEMDALILSAEPLNGSFKLFVMAVPGPIVGQFLIDYIVS